MWLLTRDDRRLDEDARLSVRTHDRIILRKGIRRQANLVAVNSAPGEQLAVGTASYGMVLASIDVDDLVVAKSADGFNRRDDSVILTSMLGMSSLGEVVEAPGMQFTMIVDVKAVVRASSNLHGVLRLRKTAANVGFERCLGSCMSRSRFPTKLELATMAPGEYLSVLIQSQHVVCAGSQRCDVLETCHLYRRRLQHDVLRETQNTFGALKMS